MKAPRAIRIVIAVVVVGAAVVGASPHAGATDLQYHCTSVAGQTDTEYSVEASAPATVAQGASFDVTNMVVTGIPPVDLLIAHITFGIAVPANATPTTPTSITFDGPGATDPPGPIAKKGIPNSSPPMSFTMTATGAVGSTIDIFPADVNSTVVDPANLQNHLDVTCSQITPAPLLSVLIVAQPPSTPPTTAAVDVLAATAAPAAAVQTQPAVTG